MSDFGRAEMAAQMEFERQAKYVKERLQQDASVMPEADQMYDGLRKMPLDRQVDWLIQQEVRRAFNLSRPYSRYREADAFHIDTPEEVMAFEQTLTPIKDFNKLSTFQKFFVSESASLNSIKYFIGFKQANYFRSHGFLTYLDSVDLKVKYMVIDMDDLTHKGKICYYLEDDAEYKSRIAEVLSDKEIHCAVGCPHNDFCDRTIKSDNNGNPVYPKCADHTASEMLIWPKVNDYLYELFSMGKLEDWEDFL